MVKLLLSLAIALALISVVFADPCSVHKSCGQCAGVSTGTWPNQGNCQWCSGSNECVSPNTACIRPGERFHTESQCPSAPTASCNALTTCSGCILRAGCGWCASMNRCAAGTRNGDASSVCPTSSWRYGTCYTNNNNHLLVVWIVLGVGSACCVLAFLLVLCIRRARQNAAARGEDAIELSVAPVGDDATGFSYAASVPAPSFGASAMPGYMYTTTSQSANQPTYLYTAVPVGAPVMSIPQ